VGVQTNSIVRWLSPLFGMPARGKTVIPRIILLRRLWRGRPWRPALHRRVRGTPVMAEPLSWLQREEEALAATHSRALSSLPPSPPTLLKTLAAGPPPVRLARRRREAHTEASYESPRPRAWPQIRLDPLPMHRRGGADATSMPRRRPGAFSSKPDPERSSSSH
jgi:hypothetical protein